MEDNSGAATLTQTQIQNTSIVLKDSFSEESQVPLASHSPDVGGIWRILNGSQQLVVTTEILMKNLNTDGTLFYNDASPNSADYSVSAYVFINNTNYDRIAGPCLRLNPQGGGYCGYLTGNGIFVLAKHSNGSVYGTKLASDAGKSLPQTTPYLISINASGTNIIATLKDTSGMVITSLKSQDTTFQSKGFAGGVIRRNNSYMYGFESR